MKKEIHFQDIPSWFVVCTSEQCPLKGQCLRKAAGLVVMEQQETATCVMPNQFADGRCKWFAEIKTHMLKVGFTHLFDNILEKDATHIRHDLITLFHGKRQYYWYLRGQRPLMPEQTNAVRRIVKKRGYEWDVPFDGEVETYVFPFQPSK